MTLPFQALLVIGATASGKTRLAHKIADLYGHHGKVCELVNLDAFQIYKGLDAGTAKPSPEEIEKYKYHCLDIVEPFENLDANTFAHLLHNTCHQIFRKGHLPVCVGGSGLYLRAFLHGLDNLPGRDNAFRESLRAQAQALGWPHFHNELAKIDPLRAAQLHPNDKTRIERALEIYHLTGKPFSALASKEEKLSQQPTLFPCFVVHTQCPESQLKEQIENRVPLLFQAGWEEEVKKLYEKYGENISLFPGLKAIGYREVLNFILKAPQSPATLKDLFSQISTLTWQYAKRQNTWNAKELCHYALNPSAFDEGHELAAKLLENLECVWRL